ncbi:MAG: bifunctional demethylmenaquinone methyltransferase/2-methoxy-6-polyprenyl-1,4-benzoquinol methylase UbiE [Paludibacteraceae bacterium]|nr:bifunctional demethylmenaquinone methyltransferase/2-methoxy-6-polyprenyl-1,4-benzoquinol methylase UbiE [Paludibacteraceae bacterium]
MENKKNIGALFDRIAQSYDKLNHILSLNIDRHWRKQAVGRLHPCTHLLDVAIGTGDLSIEIMRQKKAESIIGIDLSMEMMSIASEKIAKKGLQNQISAQYGNAQSMDFSDEQFDTVTCAYGVRNFADTDAGLKEMYRVLRSGGQLMILEFSYPTNPIIKGLYNFYFTKMMPWVGRLLSRDRSAYTYLCHSVKNFMWGEEMAEHLRQAGFKNVDFHTQSFGISTIYTAYK